MMNHFEGRDISAAVINAYNLYQSGQKQEAISLAEEIYHGAMAYFGPEHSQVVSALDTLIVYCDGAGEDEKALEYLKIAAQKSAAAFGKEDTQTQKYFRMLKERGAEA